MQYRTDVMRHRATETCDALQKSTIKLPVEGVRSMEPQKKNRLNTILAKAKTLTQKTWWSPRYSVTVRRYCFERLIKTSKALMLLHPFRPAQACTLMPNNTLKNVKSQPHIKMVCEPLQGMRSLIAATKPIFRPLPFATGKLYTLATSNHR